MSEPARLLRRVDLLWILTGLESCGIAVGELIDGELECAALPMFVAIDRAAYAVITLRREERVVQRLLANIGGAVGVGFCHRLDRLGEDDPRIIGLSMECVDRTLAVLFRVFLH